MNQEANKVTSHMKTTTTTSTTKTTTTPTTRNSYSLDKSKSLDKKKILTPVMCVFGFHLTTKKNFQLVFFCLFG